MTPDIKGLVERLLPCPHCGKAGGMMKAGGVFQAFCSDGQCLSIQTYDTEPEAAAAWNTRAPPAVPATPSRNNTMATILHDSDCAQHNEPAYPNGPCDCGADELKAVAAPVPATPVAWLLSWATISTDNKLVFLSEEAATEQQMELEDNDKVQYTSLAPLYAAPVPAHSDVRGSERDSIHEA